MGDLVTVEVGLNKAEFRVPKDLLCQHSKFFDRATSEAWNPSQRPCVVKLPEDRVHLFALFVDWLHNRLPQEIVAHNVSYAGSWQTEFQCDESTINNAVLIDCSLLVDLYIFADRLESPSFQNTIMDRIRQNLCECRDSTRLPPLKVVKHVYENTPAKSPLRQVMADAYGNYPPLEATGEFMSALEDLPQEFIVEVFRTVAQLPSVINRGIYPSGLAPYKDLSLGKTAFCTRYHVENLDGLCSLCKSKPEIKERGPNMYRFDPGIKQWRRRNSGSACGVD